MRAGDATHCEGTWFSCLLLKGKKERRRKEGREGRKETRKERREKEKQGKEGKERQFLLSKDLEFASAHEDL